MTKNTGLTKAEVEQLVADFDKECKAPALAEIKSFETQTNDLTYNMIARLVDLAETLDVEMTVTGGYRSFLVSRGVKAARGDNNPYGPFIKAVFSEKVDNSWVFDNRSAEKYANVLRHIIPLVRRNELSGSIQDYIRNYDHSTYGTKMRGIEAQDRAENPNKGAGTRVDAVREKGRNTPVLFSIKRDLGIEAHKAVMLRGRVNANGEVEVLEAKALNDDEANSFYYNLGRAA